MSLVMNGKCCHRSDILVRFCLKNCQRSILPFRCLHHRQTGFLPGRVAAIYGLHLALRTQEGKVHPLSDLQAWVELAGLVPEDVIELGTLRGMGALVAHKSFS